MFETFQRCVTGDDKAFDRSPGNMRLDPGTYVDRRKDWPNALHRRNRHAGAGDAESDMRLLTSVVQTASNCDPNVM